MIDYNFSFLCRFVSWKLKYDIHNFQFCSSRGDNTDILILLKFHYSFIYTEPPRYSLNIANVGGKHQSINLYIQNNFNLNQIAIISINLMDIIIYSVVSCFFQETEKLENKQDSLIQEIEKLRQEKEQLEELVKIHSSVCPTMKIKCSHWPKYLIVRCCTTSQLLFFVN